MQPLELPSKLRGKVLPAGTPRSRTFAMGAKRLSRWASRAGLASLRGKVKTSRTVRNLLYRPFEEQTRPRMSTSTEAQLRQVFAEDVRRLDEIAGTSFCDLWGYPKDRASA